MKEWSYLPDKIGRTLKIRGPMFGYWTGIPCEKKNNGIQGKDLKFL